MLARKSFLAAARSELVDHGMSKKAATAHKRLVGKPEHRTSKADQVYQDIKESILGGGLAPGAAIDKIALLKGITGLLR